MVERSASKLNGKKIMKEDVKNSFLNLMSFNIHTDKQMNRQTDEQTDR
jgi:hypothetical protein